jgi:hypothetical protein
MSEEKNLHQVQKSPALMISIGPGEYRLTFEGIAACMSIAKGINTPSDYGLNPAQASVLLKVFTCIMKDAVELTEGMIGMYEEFDLLIKSKLCG